jgi:DNA-binding HxlR family transcriptional regulator
VDQAALRHIKGSLQLQVLGFLLQRPDRFVELLFGVASLTRRFFDVDLKFIGYFL